MTGRCRRPAVDDDDGRPPRQLMATDFRKYLGKEGAPRPFTDEQLCVMMAGSASIYLAIMEPSLERMRAALDYWGDINAERFPRKPASENKLKRGIRRL